MLEILTLQTLAATHDANFEQSEDAFYMIIITFSNSFLAKLFLGQISKSEICYVLLIYDFLYLSMSLYDLLYLFIVPKYYMCMLLVFGFFIVRDFVTVNFKFYKKFHVALFFLIAVLNFYANSSFSCEQISFRSAKQSSLLKLEFFQETTTT